MHYNTPHECPALSIDSTGQILSIYALLGGVVLQLLCLRRLGDDSRSLNAGSLRSEKCKIQHRQTRSARRHSPLLPRRTLDLSEHSAPTVRTYQLCPVFDRSSGGMA